MGVLDSVCPTGSGAFGFSAAASGLSGRGRACDFMAQTYLRVEREARKRAKSE